jgi:gamma-glutamylcyclotransferase (GGCT)/AIG2-like uncharacterized protein YtfP
VGETQRYLFVCGTLLSGVGHEMHTHLANASRLAGRGWVRAKFYDLGGYPGMVPTSNPNDRVDGEVYELGETTSADLFRVLDEYEGVGRAEYQRAMVDVNLDDGTSLRAWAYVLVDRMPRYPVIPTSSYIEYLRTKGGR